MDDLMDDIVRSANTWEILDKAAYYGAKEVSILRMKWAGVNYITINGKTSFRKIPIAKLVFKKFKFGKRCKYYHKLPDHRFPLDIGLWKYVNGSWIKEKEPEPCNDGTMSHGAARLSLSASMNWAHMKSIQWQHIPNIWGLRKIQTSSLLWQHSYPVKRAIPLPKSVPRYMPANRTVKYRCESCKPNLFARLLDPVELSNYDPYNDGIKYNEDLRYLLAQETRSLQLF